MFDLYMFKWNGIVLHCFQLHTAVSAVTFSNTNHLCRMWLAPQKEVTWRLLLLHFFWWAEDKGGFGEGGVGWWWGVDSAAGQTKPDTGYLKAEMGGACMPNGDMDQRLISLGAHSYLNYTTLSFACTFAQMIKNLKPAHKGWSGEPSNLVAKSGKQEPHICTRGAP